MAELALKLRHYHFDFAEGDAWVEENTREVEGVRSFRPQEMALVLVDCWDRHYLKSFLERSDQIIREVIAPVREACREAGITIIHAPSPAQAKRYPQWLQYAGDDELFARHSNAAPDWPPPGFRNRSGEYEQFAKQPGAVVQAWRVIEADQRRIAPELEPREDECVIATGRQMHRLLRHRKVLHLLYAGFAANMCVLARDYGMRAMFHRGYNTILLRDCTTGIEAHDTAPTEALKRAAILEAEMLLGFSASSTDLREAIARYVTERDQPPAPAGTGGAPMANAEFVRRVTGRVARN
jgi:nicotinamidase-related amidase